MTSAPVRPLFSGVGVALVTLFDTDGSLDAGATADLARQLTDAGVGGVLVAGTTGEAFSLEADERGRLVAAVRAAVRADVPVIAGSGAPSAAQAVRLTETVLAAGADAVLVLSPPQTSDPRPYYDKVVASASGAPVLAYHFPAVSSPGLSVQALAELGVVGLKDSSGDLARLLEELDAFSGAIYTGATTLVLTAGALGCAGAILAVANVAPEEAVLAFAGDGGAQRRLAAVGRRTSGRFPHDLKREVAARFGTSVTCRMG